MFNTITVSFTIPSLIFIVAASVIVTLLANAIVKDLK